MNRLFPISSEYRKIGRTYEIRIAMSVGKENEEARTDVSANGHHPSLKYELRDQLRIFYRGIFARGSVGPHAFAGIFLT